MAATGPLPLLVSPSARPAPMARPGTLVGLLDAVEFSDVTTTLAPGDAVVLFTDGVTEARGRDGFYDDDRLVALLDTVRHAPAAEMGQVVVDAVVDFQQGEPRDDIAVLVVKVPPAAA